MNTAIAQRVKEAARHLSRAKLESGFEPDGLHEYQNADGQPVFWRVRLKRPSDGEKWIRPMHWTGSDFKLGEPPTKRQKKKPLYRLPQLIASARDSPVLITEGEKKVEALESLGLIATTSGGATSAGNADWTPLSGRECIIWPDHDEPGRQYADAVVGILSPLGCKLWVIQSEALGLQESGDAVDWLASNEEAKATEILALPKREIAPAQSETRSGYAGPSVQLIKASSVGVRPINWLWEGWLARGKIHILAGDAGTGKTTLALRMAAIVTQGWTWPDGTRPPKGSVLVWSGEDSIEDTLTPRLMAAGADLDRVSFISGMSDEDGVRSFDPAADMKHLAETAKHIPDLCMLILDPVVSATQGDSHKNTEVRRSLQPLVDLAESLGLCVIGITHFSKGTGGKNPIERVTGSLAFSAVARIVLVVGKDADAEGGGDTRVILRAKSNIGPDDSGFRYRLEQQQITVQTGVIHVSAAIFGEAIAGGARAILGDLETPTNEHVPGETKAAVDWLIEALSDGPRPAAEMKKAIKAAGYSVRTMQRAMRKAGVESVRVGFGQHAVWRLSNSSRAELGSVAPVTPHSETGAIGAIDGSAAQPLDPFGDHPAESSFDWERF